MFEKKRNKRFFSFVGLSHIVAASYTEDKFGVVQKDLSAILTLLLNLQSVGRGKVIDGRFGPKFEQCFVID